MSILLQQPGNCEGNNISDSGNSIWKEKLEGTQSEEGKGNQGGLKNRQRQNHKFPCIVDQESLNFIRIEKSSDFSVEKDMARYVLQKNQAGECIKRLEEAKLELRRLDKREWKNPGKKCVTPEG